MFDETKILKQGIHIVLNATNRIANVEVRA